MVGERGMNLRNAGNIDRVIHGWCTRSEAADRIDATCHVTRHVPHSVAYNIHTIINI